MCMKDDDVGNVGVAMVINSMLFVAGISTIVQTTFGVRLVSINGKVSL